MNNADVTQKLNPAMLCAWLKSYGVGSCACCNSDPSHQGQDEKHNQNQAQPAAWIVTPAGAIRPCRKRSEEQDDEDDKKD